MVLNFPFSDLSQTKRRPALVLAAVRYRAGHVSDAKLNEVVDRLIAILKQP